MDTWVVSTSWLLWIMLLWIWVYKYLFEMLLLVLLCIYLEVELPDHLVILFLIFWGIAILFSHCDCTILHSYQQCREVSVFLQPCQHLLFSGCFEVLFCFDSSSSKWLFKGPFHQAIIFSLQMWRLQFKGAVFAFNRSQRIETQVFRTQAQGSLYYSTIHQTKLLEMAVKRILK